MTNLIKNMVTIGFVFTLVAQAHAHGTSGSGASAKSSQHSSSGQSASAAMDDESIRHAQEQLSSKGFYTSKVDGKVGPKTRSAIRQFQEQHDLPPTGQLDQQTMSALEAGSSGT